MNGPIIRNIIVYVVAVIIIAVGWCVIHNRDSRVINKYHGYPNTMDTSAMYFTDHEIRIAQKFADSTLPGLQKAGLITRYQHYDVETVIRVSGKVWKERTSFFKENLLTQIILYNRVQNYATPVKIIDYQTGKLYAQITVSGQKKFFE